MIFRKRKKSANYLETGNKYTLNHASDYNFKGFKRFGVTTYGEDEIQRNLAKIGENYDFRDKQITAIEGTILTATPRTKVLNFYVDGIRIGCTYFNGQIDGYMTLYEAIVWNKIEQIIIKITKDGNVYREHMYCKLK